MVLAPHIELVFTPALIARSLLFTARCYGERGYETACRLSVCPSGRDVEVCFSHSLEYFENNFTAK